MAVEQVWTSVYRVKICPNTKCQARHGVINWKSGTSFANYYILLIYKGNFFVMQESLKCSDISIACNIIVTNYSGVLNISNKLLVSTNILFEMREHIRKGEPPCNATNAVIMTALLQPSAPVLTENELRYLTEKLYDGYFAFEALTDRDMQQYAEFVECAQFFKVEMGTQRTAHQCQMKR